MVTGLFLAVALRLLAAAEPDRFDAYLTTDFPPADGFDECQDPPRALAHGRVTAVTAGSVEVDHVFYENHQHHTARIRYPSVRHVVVQPGALVERGQRLGNARISATQAILAQIEQELPTHEMIPLLQMHSGLELIEIRLPDTSPVVGRSVREVLLPPESLISLVVDPGGVPRIPSGETRLNAGDALVLVTRKESLEVLRETLIGTTHGLDT